MTENEYTVRMVVMPGSIHGAVMLSEDGFANIYINDLLSPEEKRKAFDHEKRHIENNDFYNDKTIQEIEGKQ